MKGTIISVPPNGPLKVVAEINHAVDLETIKAAIGGGYIELVPGFSSFEYQGEHRQCLAFADEDRKRKQLPLNEAATVMWHRAMRAQGGPGLIEPGGSIADVLCGPVAVVFGDQTFMEKL